MKKNKLLKTVVAFFFFIILFGCGKQEFEEVSFEQAKLLAKEYLFVENDRYVLKLSESNARLLGISKMNYQNIVQLKDKINQEIAKLKGKTKNGKLCLYDYQKKLCYTNVESPLNCIVTKGIFSSLESTTSVDGYNGRGSFGFQQKVPNTFHVLELYAWTIDLVGLYSIMIEVKCTDGFKTYDVIKNGDKNGNPRYYYYNREWDPFLNNYQVARIEYDLTPINSLTRKESYDFSGNLAVFKDPGLYGGSPLNFRIVVW